jgi:hypothetical protein
VPEYSFYPGADRVWGQRAAFTDFKAWVDDQPLTVKTDVRAFVGKRDVTKVAESFELDIVTLGRFWQSAPKLHSGGTAGHEESIYQVLKLAPDAKKRLREEGLISDWEEDGEPVPVWSVRITYHWVQRFPAGKTVRIRHEYRPVAGIDVYLSSRPKDACIDPPLRRTLDRLSDGRGREAGQVRWVNYILTTANTWKMPINDFELLIEYPEGDLVSLCWDGKVERAGPRTFRTRMKDFVPTSELKVYYFEPERH